jgi:chemotaxis protein MotB
MSQPATRIIYIKKKSKGHAHHGGAWKVAYADFVTAMMALFIVLWLLTQTDVASRERIAQYFRTGIMPGGSMLLGKPAGSNPPVALNIFPQGHPAGSVAETQQLDTLKKKVQELLRDAGDDPALAALAKHVSVKIVDEGALIELVDGGDSFVFPLASSALKPGAIAFLEKLAPLLSTVHNKVEIHGHTDARPFDPLAGRTNWDLSYERANRARQVLEANGLPSGKVNGVLAHADSALFKPDEPYAPENRRLAILVVREQHEKERAGSPPALKN